LSCNRIYLVGMHIEANIQGVTLHFLEFF